MKEPEHAVIIYLNYNKDNLEPLYILENNLEKVIETNKVGEYDGHEISINYSDGILYMYGSNAESLYKTVRPILLSTDFTKSAIAKLRFGPPEENTKEIEVNIQED